MHSGYDPIRAALNRRTFLVAGGLGFCGLHLPSLVQARQPGTPPGRGGKAKSVFLLSLSGGARTSTRET